MQHDGDLVISNGEQLLHATTRRRFLGMLGAAGAIVLLPGLFAGCEDDTSTNPKISTVTLDLSSDTGILNYAYLLEQVEAGFYTSAVATTVYAQLNAAEKEVIGDLRQHEVVHREFFRALLGEAAIPDIRLQPATLAAMTSTRDQLLKSAQLLEDTGVSAYNGAGKYLTQPGNLLVAAKIVSVEARHAAAIRDIRNGAAGTLFAGDDAVDPGGLDLKAEPTAVLASVAALHLIVGSMQVTAKPDEAKVTPNRLAPEPA